MGKGLAYEETRYDYDIWRIRLREEAPIMIPSEPLIASTWQDSDADYSADGSQLVFLSTRTGSREIWICDRDGKGQQQLSNLKEIYVSHPRWSPDGSQIAFLGFKDDRAGLYLIDVESHQTRLIHDSDRHEILADWSFDGEWLYFTALRSSGAQVWKIRPSGTDAAPLIPDGSTLLATIDSGRTLIFFKNSAPGIWQRPAMGGADRCLVDGATMAQFSDLVVSDDGIHFIHQAGKKFELWYQDFQTGGLERLTTIPRFGVCDLAISPDGTELLYARSERMDCDIMFVETFR